MNFEDEMNDIAKAETTGNYISKAGIEKVTIKGYKMSPKNHKGCPYIEFTFETIDSSKSINTTRLYRVNEGDSPETIEYKNKRIKELLENACGDFTLKGEQVIKSAIGKEFQALFKEEEYIGKDGNNHNKPEIRTKITYSFSAKKDAIINGNQSYLYSPLKEAQHKKFQGELAMWERDFGGSAAASKPEPSTAMNDVSPIGDDDDDLPF